MLAQCKPSGAVAACRGALESQVQSPALTGGGDQCTKFLFSSYPCAFIEEVVCNALVILVSADRLKLPLDCSHLVNMPELHHILMDPLAERSLTCEFSLTEYQLAAAVATRQKHQGV